MQLVYDGLSFSTDSRSFWSLYEVCFAGLYDPLLERLTRSDVLIDAGANIGAFSLIASRKAGRVYSLEPNPQSFSYLESNIRKNKIDNIVPIKEALSDREGVAFMQGEGIGAHLTESNGRPVKCTTIDRLGINPTALKMDIEGFELRALLGAHASLPNIRSIALEVHGTAKEVSELLANNGFRIEEPHNKGALKWMTIKLFSLDFFVDEFRTGFALTRQVAKILPHRNTDRSKENNIVYANLDPLSY